MALSSSCLWLSHSHLPLKIDNSRQTIGSHQIIPKNKRYSVPFKSNNTELFGQQVTGVEGVVRNHWSFLGGSRIVIQPKLARPIAVQKVCRVHASWLIPGLTSSQIANSVFTLGTAAVIPFYTLMVVAPKAKLTRKSMESSIPYIALGLLYAYLLYLSWSPDTLRLMFASKYWLPELPGIAKMFSSEMTLASAWLHLLAVDLYAARQVYHDGLENEIETRHSVSLCLLFCPIGIITHVITKVLTKSVKSPRHHT